MKFDWFLIAFLVLAAAERTYELGFSKRAVRGQLSKGWITQVLHVLYTAIYAGTATEFFLLRREVAWPVTAVGLIVFVTALVLRNVAIQTLGRLWSIHLEIRKDHQLIREGIYARLRHPAYTAVMMEMIAIPLVANAYWTVLLAVGAYIPVLLVRWSNEERELIKKFGEEYVRYTKQVPAFLPVRWTRGAGSPSPRPESDSH